MRALPSPVQHNNEHASTNSKTMLRVSTASPPLSHAARCGLALPLCSSRAAMRLVPRKTLFGNLSYMHGRQTCASESTGASESTSASESFTVHMNPKSGSWRSASPLLSCFSNLCMRSR